MTKGSPIKELSLLDVTTGLLLSIGTERLFVFKGAGGQYEYMCVKIYVENICEYSGASKKECGVQGQYCLKLASSMRSGVFFERYMFWAIHTRWNPMECEWIVRNYLKKGQESQKIAPYMFICYRFTGTPKLYNIAYKYIMIF